ncbi:MAG: hypothetical protein HY908_26075 [Myxococcales bacterium]|nr:hypothetical protein [Myxococcales bacterium]MCC6526517.1 hypothetical protein [Polyangiaceae bacterium]
MTTRFLGLCVAGGVLLLASGCANPKYIAATTGAPGQLKIVYVDAEGGTGVIKCDRAEDGKLSNCRPMKVALKGE